ncbi:MAG: sigma 54-interacting transcriptional regulator [Thermodesulfobacteriota bacterium]|jgi:PAS domain S-box-containing protein|nr:sigma 54-interacting transcriptional regulator [Thermodesulfobacteriota bacterium]
MPDHVTDIILESISDGVFTVDHDWIITSFNRGAEEITGVPRERALGKHCWEVFRSNMCETRCALRRTMKEKKPFANTSTYIVNSEKRRIPVAVSTSLLKDENGRVLGGVETFRDMSVVEELRKELDARYELGDMVSRSPSMHRIFGILPQIAESDSTVLIQGETGTGKELLARAIHGLSPRKERPFIAINCGAFPDTLLESELFGYKAGAFTNAIKDKPGRFAVAEGGTILLDEIGDLSPAFQARLLRVLQERTFQPLGDVKSVKADVRIIAASNKDLSELVLSGAFRQDLFYRVNVVRLDLPPLRERKEDIPILVKHFISKLNRLRGKSLKGISEEALVRIMSYDYPGNIRELENTIEHAFALCPEGHIEPHVLPEIFRVSLSMPGQHGKINTALQSVEAQVILDALRRNKYNRLKAAHELGIHKSTLFRKIKALSIDLPKIDGRADRRRAR